MRLFTYVVILGSILLIESCGKNSLDDLVIYPNLVANGDFEDPTHISEQWHFAGDGILTPNDTNAYDGNNCVMFTSSGCMEVFNNEPISVYNNTTYELSFALKMAGSNTGCASEFVMTVTQGDSDVLYFNISPEDAGDWTFKKYYFNSTGEDINFDFIVGIDSLWLDNIEIKEVH